MLIFFKRLNSFTCCTTICIAVNEEFHMSLIVEQLAWHRIFHIKFAIGFFFSVQIEFGFSSVFFIYFNWIFMLFTHKRTFWYNTAALAHSLYLQYTDSNISMNLDFLIRWLLLHRRFRALIHFRMDHKVLAAKPRLWLKLL